MRFVDTQAEFNVLALTELAAAADRTRCRVARSLAGTPPPPFSHPDLKKNNLRPVL